MPGDLSGLLQEYLNQLLMAQRIVSIRTVTSYRVTYRLLLDFAQSHYRRKAAKLAITDLNTDLVLAFLAHLEHSRGNGAYSRIVRLATIRSFVHYAAMRAPQARHALLPILNITTRRRERHSPSLLSQEEIESLLAAPDAGTFTGRRDRVLLAILYGTGARVTEIVGVRIGDVHWRPALCLSLHGKGSKERVIPIERSAAHWLRPWLDEIDADPDAPLFPNLNGTPMTRSGIEQRVQLAARSAALDCPSLQGRRISPNALRHSAALQLLRSGTDVGVVGRRLGHQRPETTQQYVELQARLELLNACRS
jgi:site-specific recombinase XerD